jgi:hypothetical protein
MIKDYYYDKRLNLIPKRLVAALLACVQSVESKNGKTCVEVSTNSTC